MNYYVDSSAMVALVVTNDKRHADARRFLDEQVIANPDAYLTTCEPAVVETIALLQRRIGIEAVSAFAAWTLPRILVERLDHMAFMRVLTTTIANQRRLVSFVDHAGIEIARTAKCDAVFAFDKHFAEAGFTVVPATVR